MVGDCDSCGTCFDCVFAVGKIRRKYPRQQDDEYATDCSRDLTDMRKRKDKGEKNVVKKNASDELNIAMLGHKRIPSREGGIEVVVEELSTRMAALGHQVTCYNRKGHHVSGKEFDGESKNNYKGVRLKSVPTIERKGFAAVTSSFFASLFSAFGKYDVVHVHAEGPAAFCWIPKLLGKKVVVTIHGIDWQREKWKSGFGSKYIHMGEKMAVKHADEIIVLSQGVQEYFRSTYGRETKMIPNGVTRPNLMETKLITEKFGLEKDSYLLYLGRIVQEKGEHYLIDAFKKVNTEKKLVIAGGASDSAEYMEKLKGMAAGEDRIIFTGFVQGRALQELYSNAYLYVLPSDLEGMPLSLLEAMSYGNCCVVSDIPECAEVVEDKAITFSRGDVDGLRRVLQGLLVEPEKVQRYKGAAADFICQKYNWDDVFDKTLEIYRG